MLGALSSWSRVGGFIIECKLGDLSSSSRVGGFFIFSTRASCFFFPLFKVWFRSALLLVLQNWRRCCLCFLCLLPFSPSFLHVLLSLTFDFFFNLLLLNRVESCLLFSWKPHSSGLVSYLGFAKHFLLFSVPSSPSFCLCTTKSADGISNGAKHGVLQERTHFSSYFTFYLCKWLLSLFTKLECGKHREGCKLSRPDDSGMKKAACYVCILGAHAYDAPKIFLVLTLPYPYNIITYLKRDRHLTVCTNHG